LSRDLSLTGMSIRYAAILIIMIKFMNDAPLIEVVPVPETGG
jgi:hypothetical protein